MKSLNIKHYSLLIILVLFVTQANSQTYDFLRILKSFPPIPDNTLTASKKEVEDFKEKLSVINSLLWELERAEKDEEQKRESESYPFGASDFDKIDAAQEEVDLLLNQVYSVMEPYIDKEVEIITRFRYINDSLFMLHSPLIAKTENLNNTDLIYKQLYSNRLNAYRPLDIENRANMHFLISGYEKLAPVIYKLDNISIDGHKFSPKKPGLQLLREIYKSMESTFRYSVGNGEEPDSEDSDMQMIMQQLFTSPITY